MRHEAKGRLIALLAATFAIGVAFLLASDAGSTGGRDRRSLRPAADRQLTPKELAELLEIADTLITKDADLGKRRRGAIRLGEHFSHKYCIPALVAVIRDRDDKTELDADLRQVCVCALSGIADRRVLDFLIEALLDPDPGVACEAHDKLCQLRNQSPQWEVFDRDPNSATRQREYRKWRTWWDQHRDDATIYWDNALGIR